MEIMENFVLQGLCWTWKSYHGVHKVRGLFCLAQSWKCMIYFSDHLSTKLAIKNYNNISDQIARRESRLPKGRLEIARCGMVREK